MRSYTIRDTWQRPLRFLGRSDWPILPLAGLLVACGVLVQWSIAGLERFPTGHLVRLAAAGGAGVVAALWPARRWRSHAYFFYGACLVLLVVVLLTGRVTNNARRWIDLFGGFKIQPSEFMKLALILALAKWYSERPRPRRVEDLVVPAALSLCPAALVLAQPDLGTALTFAPVFFALAWMAGARWRALRWFVVVPALVLPIALLAIQDYQRERIETWWRQDHLTQAEKSAAGYHLWHAKLAVGSGGLTGFGWGEGPENRLDRLPERHNDFIFPVIAEEFGFVGASGFLLLYAALGGFTLWAAARYRDPFTHLVVAGVGVHFAVHLVLNVGVSLGVWPTTGLPLPMVSWGGSSLMVSGLAVGVVLALGASREPVISSRAFEG